jgi:hypothetical protein
MLRRQTQPGLCSGILALSENMSQSRPYVCACSCFQMNGLLAMALEALGLKVARLLCKVRWNKAPDEETTFTHIALRVTLPTGERCVPMHIVASTPSASALLTRRTLRRR